MYLMAYMYFIKLDLKKIKQRNNCEIEHNVLLKFSTFNQVQNATEI